MVNTKENAGGSVNSLWGALNDYAECQLSLITDEEPWSDWLGAAYVGRSHEELYAELMVKCAKAIAQSHELAFQVKEVKRGRWRLGYIEVARSGSALIKAALVIDMYRDVPWLPLKMAHPLAVSLIAVMQAIPMQGQPMTPASPSLLDLCLDLIACNPSVIRENAKLHVENAALVDQINRAVAVFRDMERRQRVQVRQWERSTLRRRKNIAGELLPLADNLMPRIYVVRMDLGLHTEVPGTTQEVLRCFFLRFMNNLRFKPKVSKRLLRVVWRLHIRADAISYYHCQFVLDGALAGVGAEYAELIGKYWQTEITAGRGKWFDWARHYSASCRATVGVLDLADQKRKAAFIKAVLPYFADFDMYVRCSGLTHSNGSDSGKHAPLRLVGSRHFSFA